MQCKSIKGLKSTCLMFPVKPAQNGWIIEISLGWTHLLPIISHDIFKYSIWGRNKPLNFPLLHLCVAKFQLHFISWQETSSRFSRHAPCRPLVWFFMKWFQHCGALSTAARRESPPAWFPRPEHDPPLSSEPKPQQPLAWQKAYKFSACSHLQHSVVFMENDFGQFPIGDLFIVCRRLLLTILTFLQQLSYLHSRWEGLSEIW